jgi:putative protease
MNIELLAPAGNLEKLKIAIDYGADAVYIAGQQFGLRSAADNFSTSEIEQAVKYAHDRQRKVYITVNAFLHDHELAQLPEFLKILETIR